MVATQQCACASQGLPLYVQQWRALFVKRVLSARRDRLAVVIQLLVPIALVLVALWARHATDAFPQEPALTISRCVQKSFARQLCHAWGVLIKVPISARWWDKIFPGRRLLVSWRFLYFIMGPMKHVSST